uniref:G_PROTEIN_RECEP_F1_2 domain-containing protein n=1 Tax=Strongyloides venezuelensis TaxID=75913 RepID=A0A0K0F3B0_STRVS
MNNSNPELLIDKIGRYLPFVYPTLDIYELSFIFFLAFLSHILHAAIAITIIRSWKTSNFLNSPYFKVVVVGSFTDIIDNIILLLYLFTTEVDIVAKYLKENGNAVHLVILTVVYTLSKWTYIIQDMNFLFIAIIRFLSVFYPNSYYQFIERNYIYFQVSVVIYSSIVPLISKIYCRLPYDYNYSKQMYYTGDKRGEFNCRYPFGYTEKEYHFIYIALVHSVVVISMILTLIIKYKIKKLNETSNEFSVNPIKNSNKEKRMTRYVIILGIMQLIRLIQDQFYYIDIKINGYDESIKYIILGFRPFVNVLWMFVNAVSIIFISKNLRDSVFKNLKLDTPYRKLFMENVVTPISYNLNNIQNMNRGTKTRTVI